MEANQHQAVFVTPGPGEWTLDRSHFPGGTTPIAEQLISEGSRRGFTRVFAEIGVPADYLDQRFVNGFMYTRLRPLVGADKPPRKPPPAPVLWALARVHPAFRSRARQAARTLAERPSNEVVQQWNDEIRPEIRAKNRALQDVTPEALDDEGLERHVGDLLDHLGRTFELHFWLHGHDLGPIARYVYRSIAFGLEPTEAIGALAGASPSTSRPSETLCRLRSLVEAAGGEVHDLDDVRRVSDDARILLDSYLDERGQVVTTGYDITASTLAELPDLVLESIMSATAPPAHDADGVIAELRAGVPTEHLDEFDMLLSDARNVMDMRDDNGPLTVEWPTGLLRRALLVVGARLADRGRLTDQSHAFELTPDEARRAMTALGPTASELAARAAKRIANSRLSPPTTLGDPEPQPPLAVLPPALAELVAMVQVSLEFMGMGADAVGEAVGDGLTGTGIGTSSYVGRARVAGSADEALDRLEPGDVLVVRATSPAFNSVLAIAGAVVTADGGALSHAAVLARELGIPAVIGAPGALSIPDGHTIEVDPVAGAVRLVDPARDGAS
jgi:pyruvate,water dikinase